jgi:hypothetical protein
MTRPRTINGHAAVFNVEADLGYFRELVVPGAFRDAVEQRQDVRALWNHNADLVLGRTKNGTLTLAEDARGLRVAFTPPDTQAGRDAVTLIDRGDVSGMSFAFVVVEDEWLDAAGVKPLRRLLRVKLLDVSPTAFPAYESTDVSAAPAPPPSKAARDHGRREVERLDAEALEAAGFKMDWRSERWVNESTGEVLPLLSERKPH